MMFGYSGSDGFSGFWAIGMHLHMFFALALFFGLLAAVAWLFRFATPAQLKKCCWISVLVGLLGVLITAPLAYSGMQNMMKGWTESSYVKTDDDNYRGMMDWYVNQEKDSSASSSSTTTK